MASLFLGTMEAILRWTGQMTDIDRRRCERIVPMKVLVLGLSRTGTSCESRFMPAPLRDELVLAGSEALRLWSAMSRLPFFRRLQQPPPSSRSLCLRIHLSTVAL